MRVIGWPVPINSFCRAMTVLTKSGSLPKWRRPRPAEFTKREIAADVISRLHSVYGKSLLA